jgi:hypothetical protein
LSRRFPKGAVKGPYTQSSVKKRIEALFLDNIGKIVSREMIQQVATNPKTGKIPENWHQRLSELRTDDGYTILAKRDTTALNVSEYVMSSKDKRVVRNTRVVPTKDCWGKILKRAKKSCEWDEGGDTCNLKEGDNDPVGGGTVKLTPDHLTPHSEAVKVDRDDPNDWRALCGRHQVVKKNYWDNKTGKFNITALLQASSHKEKENAFKWLKFYFAEEE